MNNAASESMSKEELDILMFSFKEGFINKSPRPFKKDSKYYENNILVNSCSDMSDVLAECIRLKSLFLSLDILSLTHGDRDLVRFKCYYDNRNRAAPEKKSDAAYRLLKIFLALADDDTIYDFREDKKDWFWENESKIPKFMENYASHTEYLDVSSQIFREIDCYWLCQVDDYHLSAYEWILDEIETLIKLNHLA